MTAIVRAKWLVMWHTIAHFEQMLRSNFLRLFQF